MDKLLETHHGYLTVKMGLHEGYTEVAMRKYIRRKGLVKVQRGVYKLPDVAYDRLYCVMLSHSVGIFSFETALAIHGLIDAVGENPHLTNINGGVYNNLKDCITHQTTKKLYPVGQITLPDRKGNEVRCYDKERCILDILRHPNLVLNDQYALAMKRYFEDPDLEKLRAYAKIFRCVNGVEKLIEEMGLE